MSSNPLEDLYTNATGQVDPAALSAFLKPYVGINRESRQIIFTPDGLKVATNKKVLLFFLARKALSLLGVMDSEAATPKETKDGLGKGIPTGTVYVVIKRLSDKGLLRKEQGKYFVPDFSFSRVKEMFKPGKNGSET